MTHITQLTRRKAMSIAQIMTTMLAVLMLVILQSSTVHAQWTNTNPNISNTNTGNVGIGTTAPVLKLDIGGLGSAIGFNPGNTSGLGTNAVLNRIVARNNFGAVDTSSAAEIKFLTGNAVWSKGQIAFYTNDYDSTQGGNTLERMRITSPGNVGIGTTAPGAKLDVKDTNNFQVTPNQSATGEFSTSVLINSRGAGLTLLPDGNGAVGPKLFLGYRDTATSMWRSALEIANTSGYGNLLLMKSGGNVGIGTTTPSNKLHVAGSITVDGNINAKYQDVAEWVESSQALTAGTVVVLDQTRSNQVIASSKAYDTRVAGVISLQPGIALGEKGAGKVLVATTGRVRIKVDASRGVIQVGDLLVTSDMPGVAMKSQPINLGGVQIHRPGTLIGKALEPLEKGTGEILVLLSLQ